MIRDFEYLVPKALGEACKLLAELGDEAKIIAGGQSLLVFMKQQLISPSYLIDIKTSFGADLSCITFDEKEGFRIGAVTSHRDIEKSPIIWKHMPILAEIEEQVADVQIRNWGTIGGNLCHGDPAGDLAPMLIVLKATVKAVSQKEERFIQIEDFFEDFYQTVLRKDEILTEIQIPRPLPRTGTAYMRLAFMTGEKPMVSAAVSVTLDPMRESCNDISIGLGAVGPTPIRARKSEEIFKSQRISEPLLEKVSRTASEEAHPISDLNASEGYKRKMVEVLVKRAIKKALEKAKMS